MSVANLVPFQNYDPKRGLKQVLTIAICLISLLVLIAVSFLNPKWFATVSQLVPVMPSYTITPPRRTRRSVAHQLTPTPALIPTPTPTPTPTPAQNPPFSLPPFEPLATPTPTSSPFTLPPFN